VTFTSAASNLVPGDTNNVTDVFVRDLQTGAVTRVSTDENGSQGNKRRYDPSISGDGRYVAFVSAAFNLVPGDANGTDDVFVRDLQTGAINRVSTIGDQGNSHSLDPSISGDGR
jgi:Tol biopolymer transport system component